MISFETVYLYFRSNISEKPEPMIGRLILSDMWHDEAYFIPNHIENMRDIDLGYVVSGKEGDANNGSVWFGHKVVEEEVRKAFLIELEREYTANKQEAEYWKTKILEYGGTIEEADAE